MADKNKRKSVKESLEKAKKASTRPMDERKKLALALLLRIEGNLDLVERIMKRQKWE